MLNKSFFIIEKLKNSESAQLCRRYMKKGKGVAIPTKKNRQIKGS